MEKTITISGETIKLKTTAATPMRYKMQFGKDYFSDLLKLAKVLQPDQSSLEDRKTELKRFNGNELRELLPNEKNLQSKNKGELIQLILDKEFNQNESVDLEAMSFEELDQLDTIVIYNFVWVLAKTADNTIPEPLTWLDSLESLPLTEVLPEIIDLLNESVKSKKK